MEWKRAALALSCALVVACGAPASTDATASSSGAAATAVAAPATQAAAATSVPAKPTSASQPKLADVLAAAKATSYKVTYKVTVSGATGLSGDQTWYVKPPRSRFDFSNTLGGQKTTISSFTLPEGSYYCFAAVPADAQCFTVTGVGSPLDQNAAVVAQRGIIDHPEQYGATFKETKTLAGQQALCYDVTGTAPGALSAGTFCYSKEGIALLSSFSVGGAAWSTEATEFSTRVPDSDFTLPAKPLAP